MSNSDLCMLQLFKISYIKYILLNVTQTDYRQWDKWGFLSRANCFHSVAREEETFNCLNNTAGLQRCHNLTLKTKLEFLMSLVNYCNTNFKDPFQAFKVTGHSTVKHAFWYEDEGFNVSSCVFLMFIALYFTQYILLSGICVTKGIQGKGVHLRLVCVLVRPH